MRSSFCYLEGFKAVLIERPQDEPRQIARIAPEEVQQPGDYLSEQDSEKVYDKHLLQLRSVSAHPGALYIIIVHPEQNVNRYFREGHGNHP